MLRLLGRAHAAMPHPAPPGSGGAVSLWMRLFEILADEVVDFLLAGIRRAKPKHVLAEGLVVRRIFAVLGARLAPLVVLLAKIRIL